MNQGLGQVFDSAYRMSLQRSGVDYEEWMHLEANERRAIEDGAMAVAQSDSVRKDALMVADRLVKSFALAGVRPRIGDNDPLSDMCGLAMKVLGDARAALAGAENGEA